VKSTIRNICKTLDRVASNHEATELAMMRAAERVGDEVLQQQLLNAIHRMSLDATQLRMARDELATQGLKRA
jgi:hypothetical protein